MSNNPIREEAPFQVTKGGPDLISPPSVPPGETWHYQVIFPFQVAPRKAAAFCNIRKGFAPGADFENGMDIIFFDDLSHVSAEHAVPISRNHEAPNPRTTPPGAPSIMMKYPCAGGFVPLGAKRPDGSPHPHAGTGFSLVNVVAYQSNIQTSPPYRTCVYANEESYSYFELFQLVYDGKTMQVSNAEHLSPSAVLPSWYILNGGMGNAIADQDDLLLCMVAQDPWAGSGSGVMRWRRDVDKWHPVLYVPVTGDDRSSEASVVRDVDGALLFCARGNGERDEKDIRVWRSSDGGEIWAKNIHVSGVISEAPVTINQTVHGTPYIAANLYQVYMHPRGAQLRVLKNAEGNVRGGGWQRDTLCIWPLNAGRTGLEAPLVARCCREEFGPPPGDSAWRADHPTGTTVQLADGKWHHVLGYRIVEVAELTHSSDPTPQTGAYLEEVITEGQTIPPWKW
ncbi:MAG: sialidase family protein [Gemmatimonadota bacterium]|nr:sialidase family protein [Gemmatimonadota bacterium]MEE2994972.1 sialidase family protein [Gemmatimonadota bacterium]